MAKKDVEEAKVQVENGAPEGTQEGTQQVENGAGANTASAPAPENTEVPEAKPAKPAKTTKAPEVQSAVKKVKIHTTDEIDAIIAGIPYIISKDKDAQVPEDVAAILVNAKKAYRI